MGKKKSRGSLLRSRGLSDTVETTAPNTARQDVRLNHSSATPHPNSWANGLPQKDHYEWFSNCYQMRCDDDYQWGGCYLHGPYDPDVTPESLIDDLLVYCILAHRADAVPSDWDWSAFLRSAVEFIIFAFEKSDAMERWGSENYFEGSMMGGRSLRFTGTQIYRSPVDKPGKSQEHMTAEGEIIQDKGKLQNQVGGEQSWVILLDNLKMCSRFVIELS